MGNKQTIIVTNGQYKDRVFDAVIGKDAFVEIGDAVETIPAGSFELFKGEAGIPEAFDASDSMFVPKLTIQKAGIEHEAIQKALAEVSATIIEEAKNRTPIGYLEEWPTPGWPEDKQPEGAIPWEKDPRTLAMSQDNDKIRARNKALKARLDRKAESNVRLSKENDQLKKYLKDMESDIKGMEQDNKRLKESNKAKAGQIERSESTVIEQLKRIQALEEELKEVHALNKHHIDQVEIGNERHRKTQHAVEQLHQQVHDRDKELDQYRIQEQLLLARLERANRIIDKLTK